MMTILSHEFHDDTLTHEFHDGNPSYLMISMMKLLSVNSWDPMITLSPHEFHAGTLNLWVQWWHSYSWVQWWHSISWVPWSQSYLMSSMTTIIWHSYSWVPWRQSYHMSHEFHDDTTISMMTLLSQWWHSYLMSFMMTLLPQWWHSYVMSSMMTLIPTVNDDTLTSWVPWWVAGSYVFGECSLSATCWQS